MRAAVALLLVVTALPATARADDKTKPKAPSLILPKPDDSLAPLRIDPLLLKRTYQRANAKRDIGMGLAIPGVALTVLGGVAIALGAYDPNLLSKASEIIAGGAAGLVGLAIGIPGIYFWSTGQDDMDVVTWRMRQLAH